MTSFPVEEATIEGIHSAMLAGELRCRTLVETYLRRIEALDRDGPRLNAIAEDAFHVVIPSMPGYGFSAKPDETGWDVPRIARAWAELMKRLGYPRYVAQGGDWGALITETSSTSTRSTRATTSPPGRSPASSRPRYEPDSGHCVDRHPHRQRRLS